MPTWLLPTRVKSTPLHLRHVFHPACFRIATASRGNGVDVGGKSETASQTALSATIHPQDCEPIALPSPAEAVHPFLAPADHQIQAAGQNSAACLVVGILAEVASLLARLVGSRVAFLRAVRSRAAGMEEHRGRREAWVGSCLVRRAGEVAYLYGG